MATQKDQDIAMMLAAQVWSHAWKTAFQHQQTLTYYQ